MHYVERSQRDVAGALSGVRTTAMPDDARLRSSSQVSHVMARLSAAEGAAAELAARTKGLADALVGPVPEPAERSRAEGPTPDAFFGQVAARLAFLCSALEEAHRQVGRVEQELTNS